MPIEYEIRPEAIWFHTRGDVDYDEGIGVLETAIADARGQDRGRRWPTVFDITASQERRSADELRAIAHFVGGHADVLEPRCAVVAGDNLHYGLARMFAAFAGEHDLQVTVLRGADEVPAWLVASAAARGAEPA